MVIVIQMRHFTNKHKDMGICPIALILEISQTKPGGNMLNGIKMFQFSQFIASLADSLSQIILMELLQYRLYTQISS